MAAEKSRPTLFAGKLLCKEDIPLLVDHFIAKFCSNLNAPHKRISTDAMRAIEK